MPPKEKKPETTSGQRYTSRYAGLSICWKKPRRDKEGTFFPGTFAKFEKHSFRTEDPDLIAFLNKFYSYGMDFWRSEETEKYLKQVPKQLRDKFALAAKDDEIARLKEELAKKASV